MAKTKDNKKKEPERKPAKKKKAEEPVEVVEEAAEPTALELLKASIQKSYGFHALRTASEVPDMFRLRRPTGIPMLDLILLGGFPAGGPSQIIGEEGGGKTDLAWRVLAEAQKNYGDSYAGAMACVEHWPDKSQARFAGMQVAMTDAELLWHEEEAGYELNDDERTILQAEPGTTEFVVSDTTEQLLDIVVELYKSGEFQVIVVDSIGAMFPAAELEKDLGEAARVAALANVLTPFMKKLWAHGMRPLPDGRYNETTMLILNQYREEVDLKNPRMSKLRIGGGRALKHGKFVDLLLRRVGWLYDGEPKKRIGKTVGAQVLKGKAGMSEGATCEWDFLHSSGVDIANNWLTLAKYHDLCKVAGSSYVFWNEEKGRGRARGKVKALELREELLAELGKLGVLPAYRIT